MVCVSRVGNAGEGGNRRIQRPAADGSGGGWTLRLRQPRDECARDVLGHLDLLLLEFVVERRLL